MGGEDRRITAFVDTGPEPEQRVDDDRADSDNIDELDQDAGDAGECDECGSPNVAYSDASAVSDALPEKPLCRKCILDYV